MTRRLPGVVERFVVVGLLVAGVTVRRVVGPPGVGLPFAGALGALSCFSLYFTVAVFTEAPLPVAKTTST